MVLGCGVGGTTRVARAADPKPPYHGTIFLEKNIITDQDPTAYVKIEAIGQAERSMFDRRVDRWAKANAWLFTAHFDDDQTMEVQVNSEFDQATAVKHAEFYSEAIGRMPRVLRDQVKTVSIHDGDKPFGGGSENILIHVQQGESYVRDGILEETLCHEAAHTSLDGEHARHDRWQEAQRLDAHFISTYAKDNPYREDVAETFLLYLAVRYRADRISDELRTTVETTVPNRLKYFDSLELKLHPLSAK
jgi:hypothetical protein